MERKDLKYFSKAEIFQQTDIKLFNEWKIFFTGYIEGLNFKHEENCKAVINSEESLEWDEDLCDCNGISVPILLGKILAYPLFKNGKYFYCSLVAKPEDKLEPNWKIIENEDINNGLNTIVQFIKFYEITGKDNLDIFEPKLNGKILTDEEYKDILYDRK